MQGEGGAGLVHGLNVSFTHREGGWGGGVGVEWWWGGGGGKSVCVGWSKQAPSSPTHHPPVGIIGLPGRMLMRWHASGARAEPGERVGGGGKRGGWKEGRCRK